MRVLSGVAHLGPLGDGAFLGRILEVRHANAGLDELVDVRLAVDVNVVLTPSCTVYIENH